MKKIEWLKMWLDLARTTRFDAMELYELYYVKAHYDRNAGLTPHESVGECLEEIEDFISRYSEVKECR